MQFTSAQIMAQKFRHKLFGGYHEVEVDMYLDSIAKYIDTLLKDKERLEEELKKEQDKHQQVQRLEETLRDTLVTAHRTSDELIKAAQEKANVILTDAQVDADQIVQKANAEAAEIRSHFDEMQRRNQNYRNSFLSLVSQQMELFESDQPAGDKVPDTPDAQ